MLQDLLDRCPPDAQDVATALGSALSFSAQNAEKVCSLSFDVGLCITSSRHFCCCDVGRPAKRIQSFSNKLGLSLLIADCLE